MTSSQNTDIVITPADWPGQSGQLSQTSTGLLNLVGWYGSTHQAAMWRKADEFLHIFEVERVTGFDPQVTGDWQASFAQVEAEVMATAAVIVIRLENNQTSNGSLGSMAEIGLALTSAALRGQIVIVSTEENLLASLTEPGAVAQYMTLEMFLQQLQKNPTLAPFFRLQRGDDLQTLARMACETVQQQARACQQPLNYGLFLSKKKQRTQNYPLQVLLGGSGGPYAAAYAGRFKEKKALLAAPYLAAGHAVKTLTDGDLAAAWTSAYQNPDLAGAALAMQALLVTEFEYKQAADVLLLPIMAEAASKAAATETGFLLLQALATGQDLHLFLEPFDPLDYIRHHLAADTNPVGCTGAAPARASLQQAGIADSTLAAALEPELLEACRLLQALAAGPAPTFKQIKQSLLSQTRAFSEADNIRRVRFLVQAHLQKLSKDERFPGFFSYSEQVA